MPKHSESHRYSDRSTFNRLMLLIAAIAQNPGIGPSGIGVSPIGEILKAMEAIANQEGIEWRDWSEHTIREDFKTLREFGLLKAGTAIRSGYYLGDDPPVDLEPVVREQRPRKSKLSPQDIVRLRDQNKTLAEIGKLAGIGREAVRQIERKARRNQSNE